ncbi:MAG: glycosyltransferase [Parvibaculum sp.]|nr:glycosyltransferase [Parvibaculum sp.]
MNSWTLILLPSLVAKRVSDTQIIITQKFLDGVLEYLKYWPGKLLVLLEEDSNLTNNLDNVTIDINQLPFQIRVVNFDFIQDELESQNNSIVLAAVSNRQNYISAVCDSKNIPCFYVSEYTLRTRIQIVNATNGNFLRRLRKYVWEIHQEWKQRKAIAQASGIQCNGTPTFMAYQTVSPHALLYFDTRVTEDMLINDLELGERTSCCLGSQPLRLVFSGRLLKIKGADHLILVAKELKKLGVRFEMSICGDGDLKNSMTSQIQALGLTDSVKMMGTLEFKNELVPFIKKNADLFICCHRQGDPSCTYLETMSCGVPILGYDNEAFIGLVKDSHTGWLVKMNRPDLLARKIAELDNNRQAIVAESYKAIDFSRQHTFEKTFQRRIDHIKTVSGLNLLGTKTSEQ